MAGVAHFAAGILRGGCLATFEIRFYGRTTNCGAGRFVGILAGV